MPSHVVNRNFVYVERSFYCSLMSNIGERVVEEIDSFFGENVCSFGNSSSPG